MSTTDTKLVANPSSAGWPYIDRRRDIPGVVAQVRATGRAMTLGPEAAEEVATWIERVGWEPNEAPMILVPLAA
jgi:hypothetical protein